MRTKKKIITMTLTAMMTASLLAGCNSSETKTGGTTTVEATTEAKQEGLNILYPTYAKESHGESLQLETMPKKIICLSNTALEVLADLDIHPIAITSTVTGNYPDWVSELPTIETGMSKLDTESVISMSPDLVIMGDHLQEDYGKVLDDAGIPVYYTSEGHGIAYEETKEQSLVLAESFGGGEERSKLEAEFQEVEDRAKEYKESHDTKKAMILFTPTYQSTSESYLGSMLAMMGFENISDSLIEPSMQTAPLDMEQFMEQDPDIIFALYPGVPTAEMTQTTFEEEFKKNPQVWNNVSAIKDEKIIYLSGAYATAKGASAIDHMNDLMDLLEEKFD